MPHFVYIGTDSKPLPAGTTEHVALLDEKAGLMWARLDLSDEEVTQYHAEELTKELRLLGHSDWRLPTVEELFALADRTRVSPAIDIDAFPECKSDWYWSSSLYAGVSGHAWIVYFSYGDANGYYRDGDDGFVRAVRSVAPASPGQ